MRISRRSWFSLALFAVAVVLIVMRFGWLRRSSTGTPIADRAVTNPLNQPGGSAAPAEAYEVYSALYQAPMDEPLPEAPADLKLMRTLFPDVLDLHANFTWLSGRSLRSGLWMLLGASALILLLASVKMGGLVLSRAMSRSRDMAIRAAIGASRRQLVGQTFAESVVVGFAGTIAGVAVTAGLLAWFRAANPIELPPGTTITPDWRVFIFTALSGTASSIVFGMSRHGALRMPT
jgi:hypothetical protein